MTKSQPKSQAKSLPKLVLSSSRDIPFSRLELSQKNVRRVKSAALLLPCCSPLGVSGH